jgi:hypothetical protein
MKSYSFLNDKEERLLEGQLGGFMLWLVLTAFVIAEIFIIKAPSYSIELISISFLVSLIVLAFSSFCKVKLAVLSNLKVLKFVPNINLRKCLYNVKRIAILEELLKVNFINIALLVIMACGHIFIYKNEHMNTLLLFIPIAIQIYCYAKLLVRKSRQATFLFPEVKQAHQKYLNERTPRIEADRHLTWL